MIRFLKERMFWMNVLFVLIAAMILLYVVHVWLKQYTHHGEAIKMELFEGLDMSAARQLADEHTFRLVVTDSVHIIGKPGGLIINQNPAPEDLVKQGRKVYVTTTKYNPDMIRVKDLPELYGKSYERKKKALNVGYSISSEVVGEVYDKGPPGYIMMVLFEGDTIITRDERLSETELPKGARLSFVLSKSSGGDVPMPDLRCMTYDAAKFVLNSYQLTQSAVQADATVDNYSSAIVYRQEPEFEEGKLIPSGTGFTMYLTQAMPVDCE